MSKLIVEVCKIDKIQDHPNADRMKIAQVKGWQVAIKYDPETKTAQFQEGDKCIFFPPDSILPPEIYNSPTDEIPGRLGIGKYLHELPKVDGIRPTGKKVTAARLRQIPSFGVLMPLDANEQTWEIGTDVAEYFGITKYEPPPVPISGDMERENSYFYRYTSIENYRNFPDAFTDEEVVVLEKLHGTNNRMSIIFDENEWKFMAGSHHTSRKEFNSEGKTTAYWEFFTDNVKNLLNFIKDKYSAKLSVVLYGEIYGAGVQDMAYGLTRRAYQAFDVAVDNTYLDYQDFKACLNQFEVDIVPLLYQGPFNKEIVEKLTSGNSVVYQEPSETKGMPKYFTGREGIVIKPVKEKKSPILNGRLILKSISVDYLSRKNGTEFH